MKDNKAANIPNVGIPVTHNPREDLFSIIKSLIERSENLLNQVCIIGSSIGNDILQDKCPDTHYPDTLIEIASFLRGRLEHLSTDLSGIMSALGHRQ